MKAPIFIVGMMRSGTTLLRRILDNHPNISIYHESSFLHFVERVKEGDLQNGTVDVDAAISEIKNLKSQGLSPEEVKAGYLLTDGTMRSLFDIVLRLRMEKNGKKRFGEKNPTHFLCLDRIFNYYPDAKVVFIYRDPRNACSSSKRNRVGSLRGWSLGALIQKTLFWNLGIITVENFRGGRHAEQIMPVKFEDLIKQPERAAASICKFVHEEFDEAMLSLQNPNTSFDESRNKKGILAETADRSKFLTKSEVCLIELICGRHMIERGYETRILPSLLVKILIRLGYYRMQDVSYSRLRVSTRFRSFLGSSRIYPA
jgi:hypothetical protein